jgi:pimeloyl-ACP methyl ester carboxylesterase
MPVTRTDVGLTDGRLLTAYDSGSGGSGQPTVVWHHGSPQTGALLPPLLSATADRGLRLVSYARPSYRGSTPRPGRDVASAADDVAQLADALGIDRFAVMGASGGGPHALACAALLPGRVTGVVTLAGLAPYTEEFDWYAGMCTEGGLRSAALGRDARALHAETAEFDLESFTAADWAALEGEWTSLGEDAQRAGQAGPDGLIDDDVAFAKLWGFDLGQVETPALLVHGGQDRVVPPSHSDWMLRQLPASELWFRPTAGHISILYAVPVALDWLMVASD